MLFQINQSVIGFQKRDIAEQILHLQNCQDSNHGPQQGSNYSAFNHQQLSEPKSK